jgi:hypothetical protein
MKLIASTLLVTLGMTSAALAQTKSPAASASSPAAAASSPAAASPAARTDIYHVHFAKSATGKAAEHGDDLKKQDPKAPMPGHIVVFRHLDGDAWDYCVIEHLGTKATVEANRPAPAANQIALGDWHTDTFASGPSWTDSRNRWDSTMRPRALPPPMWSRCIVR